jgi:hypothetical protein
MVRPALARFSQKSHTDLVQIRKANPRLTGARLIENFGNSRQSLVVSIMEPHGKGENDFSSKSSFYARKHQAPSR